MQIAWIWMRRWLTLSLNQIQDVWHSDIFINFERHWRTLKIEADNLFGGLRVNLGPGLSKTGWSILLSSQFLTLSPQNKFSAQFHDCLNFQNASLSLKVVENVVWMSNSLDPGERPSYSASHPDQICLHMAIWSCLAGLGLKKKDLADSKQSAVL